MFNIDHKEILILSENLDFLLQLSYGTDFHKKMYSYVNEEQDFSLHCIFFQRCKFLTISSILKNYQSQRFKLRSSN